MPQVARTYAVYIIESERGWGQRIDEILHFDNEAEARQYVINYNSKNPPGPAPDWYMQAEYVG